MPQSSLLSENARPCSPGSPPSPVPSLRLHRGNRKALHPLADESEDGYSSHPSIYSASPVGSESDRGCQDSGADSVALPKTEGIFEQDVEEDGGARLAERRNFSSFSGLSMLDTISEQKSAGSRSVLHDDEDDDDDDGDESDDEDDDGDTCTVDSEDDEYGYGRSYYYEYASPTQPLHPARSQSVPPRDINPVLGSQSTYYHQPSSVPVVHTFFSRSPTRSPQNYSPPPPQRQTFRPPTSMNRSYGSLMAHPFHRAPMADSGRAIIEADNSPTPDELESPRNESATNLAGESGWNKFFRGCCLVCCCMVVADDGRQRR